MTYRHGDSAHNTTASANSSQTFNSHSQHSLTPRHTRHKTRTRPITSPEPKVLPQTSQDIHPPSAKPLLRMTDHENQKDSDGARDSQSSFILKERGREMRSNSPQVYLFPLVTLTSHSLAYVCSSHHFLCHFSHTFVSPFAITILSHVLLPLPHPFFLISFSPNISHSSLIY